MARVKTNFINVKVDDKGTKVKVSVNCADVSTLSLEALQKLYESQWKQYMYPTVQQTVKEMYPAVAVNLNHLSVMRQIPGITEEQIQMFLTLQKASSKFETELPNHFTLKSDLTVEYSTITPAENEEVELDSDSDENEESEEK